MKVLSVIDGVATVELDPTDLHYLLHPNEIKSRTRRRRFLNRFRALYRETAESRVQGMAEWLVISTPTFPKRGWGL